MTTKKSRLAQLEKVYKPKLQFPNEDEVYAAVLQKVQARKTQPSEPTEPADLESLQRDLQSLQGANDVYSNVMRSILKRQIKELGEK